MGDDGRPDNPRRIVTLSGYWIYKNLVTVGMYKQYCSAQGVKMPQPPGGFWQLGVVNFNPRWSKEDHPIVNVTWNYAQEYCKWAGVILPTEAQWEKAARGTDGRKFPWGNKFDARNLWCSVKQRRDGTAPVGERGISPYGCNDMAGNVWQWCLDWYDAEYITSEPCSNPTGPVAGQTRFLRGGSWIGSDPDNFSAARRIYDRPLSKLDFGGFRGASGVNIFAAILQ